MNKFRLTRYSNKLITLRTLKGNEVIFKIIKNKTKQHENYQFYWDFRELYYNNKLTDIYKKPSKEKLIAYNKIVSEFGEPLTVIGNTYSFVTIHRCYIIVGYNSSGNEIVKEVLLIFTKSNNYIWFE